MTLSRALLIIFATIASIQIVASYNSASSSLLNRRNVLQGLISAATTGAIVALDPAQASAEAPGTESVYFGVGCFWHIQHEFVQAERDLLGRGDRELTSKAGYAGGNAADKFGRVCYHNFQGVADYGKFGHGEVVGMDLPADKVVDFSKVYFSLFNPRTKERVDPQDRGGEYRSLIGLPGGTLHEAYPAIAQAATDAGFKLEAGKGNDPDTLGKQLVYVYDTKSFPFYQAEVYHQYHNDFQSPAYGKAYNQLADKAFEEGRLVTTGCPDKV